MSLRIRLLVVSLALLIAGLTAAGLVSYSSLSSFLHARTDTQLDSAIGNVRHVLAALPAGETISRQDLGGAAAAYVALSLGALCLSINGGLFGFNETLNAPWVKFSLVDEIVGLAACLAAAAITLGSGSTRTVSSS